MLRDNPLPGGLTEARLVPLRTVNLALFSGEEIAVIDETLETYKDMTGTQLSALSHKLPGWRFTPDRQTISYSTVFLPEVVRTLSGADLTWAKSVASRAA